MNDFNDYATKAINRCNLKSYYGLAKTLGLSYAAISYFKNGKKLPSYDNIMRQKCKNILCRLFNVLRSFLTKMEVCYG